MLPVKAEADVPGGGLAQRQVAKVEAVRDQLQDRLVAVLPVIHAEARALGLSASERRHRERRDPEAHLAEVLIEVGARSVVGHVRRPHVVEEAAPLVVDHEQRGAR
jgi:hypothetical protein